MNKPTPISVTDFKSLLSHMEQADLWVEWTVRCEIGPDWIGGGRFIQFHLDEHPLADTKLHATLREALIHVLNIPDANPDAVLTGEGELYFRNGKFELEYSWYEAVPYMHVRNSGGGTVVLLSPSF